MKYFLKNYCRFVTGARGAAIYDLENGKVYALNETGKDIVAEALDGTCEFNNTAEEYLSKLIDMQLMTSEEVIPEIDPVIAPELNYVWLELTDACNMKCIHCYGHFGYNPISKADAMSTEDWKKVIDELVNFNCKEIQLIGGEPMAFEGFTEILNYAHHVGMNRIDIFTNGSLLDDEKLKAIKATQAHVRVSLYGPNAKVHEAVTLQKGSFQRLEQSMKLLKENDIPLKIAVVLMKENEAFQSEIKAYIESLGLEYTGYDTIRATSESLKMHYLSNAELLGTRYQTKPNFHTSRQDFVRNKLWNSCWFGKAAISAAGDVLPCIFARNNRAGNVKLQPLDVIKVNLLKLWRITKNEITECRDCEFRYACHDCRPLALGLGGDLLFKNPRCCYDPFSMQWNAVVGTAKEIT